MARILAFAGSARRDSLNRKLARVAAEAARDAGAEVTFVDLDDYPMPLYHGDLEAAQGMPENAMKLRELFLAHDRCSPPLRAGSAVSSACRTCGPSCPSWA